MEAAVLVRSVEMEMMALKLLATEEMERNLMRLTDQVAVVAAAEMLPQERRAVQAENMGAAAVAFNQD